MMYFLVQLSSKTKPPNRPQGEKMSPLQKIEELLMLPGVNQMPERLRLHEQFFHPLQGPNKVGKGYWLVLVLLQVGS